jgi:holliday junction DNA helicase RuvB
MIKLRGDETEEQIAERLRELASCDFIFFDEAHRLDRVVQELLYEVIDQSVVPARLVTTTGGQEPVKVAPITFIFATDQPGQLLNALYKRIPSTVCFQQYPENEMKEIVARIAARRRILLSPQAARQLARVCHGIPRRAEHRVNDVRLYFDDSESRQLGQPDILSYLRDVGIDEDGLDEIGRRYMRFLDTNGHASLEALTGHLGVDADYIRHQVEQPLWYRGLITVRSSGRVLTPEGTARVRQRPLPTGTDEEDNQ